MNNTQKTTLNLPEYNPKTNKHTITLEINKTSKKYDYKLTDIPSCILFWKSTIQDVIRERLETCKNHLAMAVLLGNIIKISEHEIHYIQNGSIHHYSYPAAKAMERVISELNEDKLDWIENYMCIKQVLKALTQVPLNKRETTNDYPYSSLIDILWELPSGIKFKNN